jgi:hypothetical protein
METIFTKLNDGWNAEPNCPLPAIGVNHGMVTLTFFLNAFVYKGFVEGDRGQIIFRDSSRYRLGRTNDEGWYLGQCRFSRKAPAWGEFYEIDGDLQTDFPGLDWKVLNPLTPIASRHFLFYFRDNTFECDAEDWEFSSDPGIFPPLSL